MAVKRTPAPRGSSAQPQDAAEVLLQREQQREQIERERAKRRRRKRLRKQRREEHQSVERMHHSIEVIKWCIVAICAVWVVSFVVSIFVLVRVHNRVVEIEGKVQRIQHVMENPFASAGANAGADLDRRLRQWLQLPEAEATAPD